ncbi:MAG: SGNH/GDSL hydrolase family protein [Chitinophagaceae bacterium]
MNIRCKLMIILILLHLEGFASPLYPAQLNFQKSKLQVTRIDTPGFSYRELSYKEIVDHTTGVVDIERSGDSLVFNRYPNETIKVLSVSPTWEVRAHSTSGIATSFITNSNKLFLSGSIVQNSPQSVPFHIFCNEKIIDVLPGKEDTTFNFSIDLDLPPGVKNKMIQIVFPAYSKGVLRRICLQKGASLEKKIFKGKMLAYGNSISQNAGEYNGFLTLAANNLGYSLHDAGIGGHIFQAEYLTQSLVKNPNIILVEYGTNDWSGNKKADNAKPFLDKLCSMYPGVPVAVIEPLYRFNPANTDAADPFKNKLDQSLEDYRQALRTICKEFKKVTVLDHKMLLPKNPDLFTDGVHLNEEGQKILSDNLTTLIKKIIGNK